MSVNFFLDNRVKPISTTCLHRSLGPCHSRPLPLMEPFAPARNGFCFFLGAVTTGQLCAGSQRWPCSNRLFLFGCSEPGHQGGQGVKGHAHTKYGVLLSTQGPLSIFSDHICVV